MPSQGFSRECCCPTRHVAERYDYRAGRIVCCGNNTSLPQFSLKSCHLGLTTSISATFLLLLQPFSCFSLPIASLRHRSFRIHKSSAVVLTRKTVNQFQSMIVHPLVEIVGHADIQRSGVTAHDVHPKFIIHRSSQEFPGTAFTATNILGSFDSLTLAQDDSI